MVSHRHAFESAFALLLFGLALLMSGCHCSGVGYLFDIAAMPRTSRGYTRDRGCERERRRERGRAPCLRRRQRPDLQDAICRHCSAWKTCSTCGASTTSKARSHTTLVRPFRCSGGDGSNKKLVAAFVSDAGRYHCPGEQRPVAWKRIGEEKQTRSCQTMQRGWQGSILIGECCSSVVD